jgi:hypothetical protein
MTNWGAAVPVIVAIIGISRFIVPPLSVLLINQIYNKPNVNIEIGTVGPGKTMINLTNSGTMPATNLSLTVTSNNKTINDITNVFSTVNVTSVIPGSPHSILKINSPKPINGPFVEIHAKKFVNELVIYNFVIILLYFYIAESIVVVYLVKRRRKLRKTRFILEVTQEMMNVRKALRKTLSDKKNSDKYWTRSFKEMEEYWINRQATTYKSHVPTKRVLVYRR